MKEITNDMLARAKECKSIEELKALAVENKIEASNEELEKIFSKYCNSGEVADDELDNVSGGCGSGFLKCPRCGCTSLREGKYDDKHRTHPSLICNECGKEFYQELY